MDGDPANSRLSTDWPTEPFNLKMRFGTATLIFGSWLYSLFVPAAYFVQFPEPVMGYEILALGWMGVLGALQPAWLANIGLIIMLLVFLTEGRTGGCLVQGGVFMTLFSISALFWHGWPRAGTNFEPVVWGPGFYLWISAMVGIALASFIRFALQKNQQRAEAMRPTPNGGSGPET